MEVDRRGEVLRVAEATGLPLDAHDLAVQSFGHAVGDRMLDEAAGDERSRIHGTFQELGERLDTLDQRAQKHVHGLRIERATVSPRAVLIDHASAASSRSPFGARRVPKQSPR